MFFQNLDERTDITNEDKSRLITVKIAKEKEKNLNYRVKDIRQLDSKFKKYTQRDSENVI